VGPTARGRHGVGRARGAGRGWASRARLGRPRAGWWTAGAPAQVQGERTDHKPRAAGEMPARLRDAFQIFPAEISRIKTKRHY